MKIHYSSQELAFCSGKRPQRACSTDGEPRQCNLQDLQAHWENREFDYDAGITENIRVTYRVVEEAKVA